MNMKMENNDDEISNFDFNEIVIQNDDYDQFDFSVLEEKDKEKLDTDLNFKFINKNDNKF